MRSYNYVADCVSAIFTVLINGNPAEAYNIANPDSKATIAGFAQIVASVTETKVIFEDPSERDIANQTPIARQVLNTDKLEALGWKGVFRLKDGIQHTLAILKEAEEDNNIKQRIFDGV